MSSKQEHPIQAMGFWMFGFLSVVLAVLKLTVAGYWSWWRVMLPFLAFLGHNAVYLLAGFLCFCWLLSLVAQLVYWSRIVSGLNQEHA
jgi:hypothetical protein